MKPLGVSLAVNPIGLSVSRPSRAEDAVWEAVEAAIEAGWSPKRFKDEAADAWRERLTDEAADAYRELTKL